MVYISLVSAPVVLGVCLLGCLDLCGFVHLEKVMSFVVFIALSDSLIVMLMHLYVSHDDGSLRSK